MNATRLTLRIPMHMKLVSAEVLVFCRRILWFPTSLPKSIRIRDKCLLRLGSEQVLKERGEFLTFLNSSKELKIGFHCGDSWEFITSARVHLEM